MPKVGKRFFLTWGAVLLLVMLCSFGCTQAAGGSTNSSSSGDSIASLTVNGGQAITPSGTVYTANVTSETATAAILLTLSTGAGATLNGTSGTNQTITLGAAGTTTLVAIVVTAEDGTTATYTLNIVRAAAASSDATLGSLSASGITVNFSSSVTSYTPIVPNGLGSTTITAAASDSNAQVAVKIDGQAQSTATLTQGTHVVLVTVTAQDGTTTMTYTITLDVADSNLSVTVD
jgi:hypothetical protein